MYKQQLHWHAIPIMLLGMAVFMLGVVVATTAGDVHNRNYRLSLSGADTALTTSIVRIKPNKYGLARIRLRDDNTTVRERHHTSIVVAGKNAGNAMVTTTIMQQMDAQLSPQ
jgi:hypothetical protein